MQGIFQQIGQNDGHIHIHAGHLPRQVHFLLKGNFQIAQMIMIDRQRCINQVISTEFLHCRVLNVSCIFIHQLLRLLDTPTIQKRPKQPVIMAHIVAQDTQGLTLFLGKTRILS